MSRSDAEGFVHPKQSYRLTFEIVPFQTAPLLESDDEDSSVDSDGSDASEEEETVKKSPMQKLKTLVGELYRRHGCAMHHYPFLNLICLFPRVVYGVLGCGVVASAGAMVLAPVIAIFVMGGICIAK